jgi:hypothetical protein
MAGSRIETRSKARAATRRNVNIVEMEAVIGKRRAALRGQVINAIKAAGPSREREPNANEDEVMTDQSDDETAVEAEAEVKVSKFPVTSIEKADPPDGETDGEWYEYVIGIGSSVIKGKRSGSLKAVTAYVKEYAENLNERSALGYSSYAARKVQK